jgi:Shikimate kinase
MLRIFLIGYMGAGKTTLGRELSGISKLSFIDLDHFIEGRYHKTIRQIFEEESEATFREIEKKTLHEVAEFEDLILSTGGGTPCFFDNMTYMNSVGTTVYLKASPRALTERIELCRHTRPAVRHLSGDPLYIFVSDALTRRAPFYDQAQIIFDVERLVTHRDVRAAASQLWEIIRESCPS